jgi:hypothetical protein
MKEIPLTNGYTALVDDENYEAVNNLKWLAQIDSRADCRTVYARHWFPKVNVFQRIILRR